MAQAGMHALIAVAIRKWSPSKTWLLLGIVLGNLVPDADNLAVAIATVIKKSTEGLHRTFTHSLFTIVLVIAVFYLVQLVTKKAKWGFLGLGLGIGIFMHILLDLLIWFNGVAIFWPFPFWLNLWQGVTPPLWFDKLMMSTEFLFFALFFLALHQMARKTETDGEYLPILRFWMIFQFALCIIFTVLVYVMQKGFMTPYGAVYLLSLALAIGITIRMRKTIAASVK